MFLTRKNLIDSVIGLSILGIGGAAALQEFRNSLGALYKEDRTYDPSIAIKPNEAQRSFLKQIAEEYDFIALGDTNHTHAEINAFAINTELLAIFSNAGKIKYFLEMPPSSTALLDPDMAEGPDFIKDCEGELVPGYLPKPAIENLCHQWKNAITSHPDIDFTPIDTRELNFFNFWRYLFDKQLTLDDRKPFAEIKKQALPDAEGIIFYGAGHFQGMLNDQGDPIDMKTLIENAGHSIYVVNIFKTEQAQQAYRPRANPADADFIIFPGNLHPSGIFERSSPHHPAEQPTPDL